MPTLTAALREAYASCPDSVAELATLEIYHSTWPGPVRLVRDRLDLTATLEANAPRNASTAVLFTAFPFDFTRPKQGEGSNDLTITVDNASRLLMDKLEALDWTVSNPVQVIFRSYVSTDLTAPGFRLVLNARSASIDVNRFTMTCGYADFTNRKFQRRVYRREEFPGLASRV